MFLVATQGDAVLVLVSHGLYFPVFVLSAVWKSIKHVKNIYLTEKHFTHTVNRTGEKNVISFCCRLERAAEGLL